MSCIKLPWRFVYSETASLAPGVMNLGAFYPPIGGHAWHQRIALGVDVGMISGAHGTSLPATQNRWRLLTCLPFALLLLTVLAKAWFLALEVDSQDLDF